MTIEIVQAGEGGIVHARITGELAPADQKMLEGLASRLIDDGNQVSLLVTLDAFVGWKKDPGWEEDDLGYQLEYANRIVRMAIVGDERWRDPALLFVGKGFRDTEIEFFTPDAADAAQAWLEGK
jgi:hypothetical protein